MVKLNWAVKQKSTEKTEGNAAKKRKIKRQKSSAMQEESDLMGIEDLNALQWKSSKDFPKNEFMPFIEEIDGVDVFYQHTKEGKVARFKPSKKHKQKTDKNVSSKDTSNSEAEKKTEPENTVDFDTLKNDMSKWSQFNFDKRVLKALDDLNFTEPTLIQTKVLPEALLGKDIVGISETGSGKSLAFLLPIISSLLQGDLDYQSLSVLILSPTRELSSQIHKHLKAVTKYTKIKSISIFGGMSPERQERLLNQKPHIIIATPGRFMQWLIDNCHEYLNNLEQLRYLVIDEADRMVERGHFKDLELIFGQLKETKITKEWDDQSLTVTDKKEIVVNSNQNRQTMVFSATINAEDLDSILKAIPFSRKSMEVIDVSTEKVLARALDEARIDCLVTDKDAYLLYLIRNVKGKKLVFANSIDCVRKISDTFRVLNIPILNLHAQLQQRSRLENLEKFASREDGVLVASDVAARGLDIPAVDLVIHYQIPKGKDLYVHRSGRTARANKAGLAIMLCAPEERKGYHKLLKLLGKDSIEIYDNIDIKEIEDLLKVTRCASKIATAEYRNRKEKKDETWAKKMAEEMDIILSEEEESDEEIAAKSQKHKNHLITLRSELHHLIEMVENKKKRSMAKNIK